MKIAKESGKFCNFYTTKVRASSLVSKHISLILTSGGLIAPYRLKSLGNP